MASIYGNPETPLLRGESSVYSLTLDEFQNVLGERGVNLESMNMEELLKNIWTAEESEAMAAAMDSVEGTNGGLASQLSLQNQASMSLPKTMNGRTVEDVWKTCQPQQGGAEVVPSSYQRQFPLGEVTLEEFLLKAGMVREQPPMNPVLSNQVLKSQVIQPFNPGLKPSILNNVTPNQVNLALNTQPPDSAKFSREQVSRQPITPSSQMQATVHQQKATPHLGFGGFAGNAVFSIPRDDGIKQIAKHQDGSAPIKSSMLTTPNTSMRSSSPDMTSFDGHNNRGAQGRGLEWVNKSHGHPCGGSKLSGHSLTFQSQHAPQSMQQQNFLETTPQFGAVLPKSVGPPIESSASRMSTSGGALGSVPGIGGPGMGLGVSPGSTRISFGTGLPLSPFFDEGGAGISNFPTSMIPDVGNGLQPRRKRLAEAPLERVIERRQRRMIKNRESAARSRARKLAYTVELEAEVSQLKEENMRLLQKQEEELAIRKNQILGFMPARVPGTGCKGSALKRTHTLPW